MWKIIAGLVLLCAGVVGASAQSPTIYQIANGLNATLSFRAFTCSGPLCTSSIPIDYNGVPLTGPAGTPSTQGMTVQGMGASGTPLLVLPGNTANTVPWLTTISQGGNAAVVNGSGQLSINCANCTGSGVSQQDSTPFTQTSSNLAPIGGIFTNSISNLASGQAGIAQMTADRMLFVNLGKIGGTTVLTGVGAAGGGAARVAVAQDTTTIAGSAPGTAGAPSANVFTIQGVTSMTPVQVSQATASNLNATVVNAGTFLVQATESGNWTTRAVGNTGASFDAASGSTAPANGLQVGGIFQTSPPTLSNGQFNPFQLDSSSRLVVNCVVGCSSSGGSSLADAGAFTQSTTSFTVAGGIFATAITNLAAGQGGAARVTPDRLFLQANAMTTATLAAWSSGTGANATQTIMAARGAPAVIVQLDQTSTLTAGAVTWEGTYDGTNWVTLNASQVVDPTSVTLVSVGNPYSFAATTNKPFLLFPAGMQSLRMRLSTTITGSGTVTPFVTVVDTQAAQSIYNSALYSVVNAGVQTVGSAVPSTAVYFGGTALSSEPAKATSGNLVGPFFDLVGKIVTAPYANRENQWRGGGTSTSTAAVTLLAAAGANIKTYLTDLSCTRNDTGATAITLTINDSSSWQFDVPNNGGGGGYSRSFEVPLVSVANTALTVTSGTGVTTLKCWGAGFTGY